MKRISMALDLFLLCSRVSSICDISADKDVSTRDVVDLRYFLCQSIFYALPRSLNLQSRHPSGGIMARQIASESRSPTIFRVFQLTQYRFLNDDNARALIETTTPII
jgi:hypothetical protein